ncbi:glycosyltransferase [Morganella morganii]|uniref:glycosyltransferase n=1 Tax=Morganella morganii TaxID=582 RepID=UPI00069CB515|nr:glycosyltransferase [Morganella morganii]MDF2407245.1 glycosyltransferase [Morganella morganii]
MTKLVTIIIPSYNHSRYIGKTIKSVLLQTYTEIELIIIDDGSIDNSIAVINSYESECQSKLKKYTFIHRNNKGLCATLNEAIKISSGEYISIIASDDIMKKDKTLAQVNYLNSNIECVGVFSGADVIKENGELLVVRNGSNKKYYFKDIITNNYQLFSPSAMYRSLEIKEAGLYRTDILLEDWYMNLKLTEKTGYLIALPDVLICYRRHSSNTSLLSPRLHQDRKKILDLFANSIYYDHAKLELKYTIAYESVTFNKIKTLKYLLYCIFKNKKFALRRQTLVTIAKLFFPKKYLNKRLTGK